MIRWSILAFLATAVAAYAIAIVIAAPIRPPLVRELLANWPIAARAHFLGGAVALVLGALQMNSRLRARYLVAHRWTGRVYLAAVAVAATAGFALALDSFAGPVARIAGISFMVAYPAIAWLCWVPNLAIAEWLVRSRRVPALGALSATGR